ncbi:MAG TPA: LacI family DNA-binding transcriptional regulator [Jatrophihabitans sp.]|jgi:LacI family transcriptional regulator|uniref:LacI family DNA-binding transcriptional regulator n=1 Tax=Jatrophihabitans sp. TaxID=1932789 RepID=UPI002F11B7B8
MNGRTILRDVAEAAGVSLRTASRVLNDDHRVASATRQRVQQAMRELQFQPDAMARSLRAGTDTTIGLIVESVADPFFSALTEAVEAAITVDGKSVLVASTHRDSAAERRIVDRMLQRRVGGLLISPTGDDHSWLAHTPAPVVFVDRAAYGLQADLVGIDDHRAAVEAVSHLLKHGHRRIAYVGDSPAITTSAARLAGYRDALASHGVTVEEQLVRLDCVTAPDAAAATAALLDLEEPPTAIFSAGTRSSLGVVPTLHARGRAGIALVGFGDFAMADTLRPAITVIDHSASEVGRAAAARLLARIADPGLRVEHLQVPVRLIQRGSGEQRP